MKRLIYIFSILALSLAAFSCKVETPEESSSTIHPGEPARISLPFYCGSSSDVDVRTKVTLGDSYEGKIYNLYIAIYNEEGKLMYNMFYDLYTDGWSYTQNGSTSQGQGEVDLSTYQAQDCSIYMVANISTSMYNLNADKLKVVGINEAGLRNMVAKLNQNIVSRDGFFLMTGWLKHVDIAEQMVITNASTVNSDGETGAGTPLRLDRLDAKITFNVTCSKPDDPATQPTIESFTPTMWRIINVPRRAYVMETGSNAEHFGTSADNYFNSEIYRIFHNTPKTTTDGYDTNTFSFYLTESKLEANNPITTYAERELQEKNEFGYNGAFVNAPEFATYVILDGELTMQETNYDPVTGVLVNAGRTLSADVRYKIHLGDISSSISDFKTLRNHDYKYNVTIKGVDNITIEVITSDNSKAAGGSPSDAVENTPGATGEVTLALEKFVTVDAHYATFVHSFAARNIDEALTWYVKTPFSKGAAVNNPADYKWVTFRINELGSDGKYKKNRRTYKPLDESVTFDANAIYNGAEGSATASPTMTVKELSAYLKAQKVLQDAGETNAFDSEGNLAVTFFVDEYYYDVDPRDGLHSDNLWTKFVGSAVSPRIMHILSKTMESYDEESYVIASTISVKQKTIQTVYSTTGNVTRAWGCEQDDESPSDSSMGWRGTLSSGQTTGAGTTRNISVANGQNEYGRLNTAKEWGVYGTSWSTDARWDTYLDQTTATEGTIIPDLKSGYNYLAYQCMTRNRDNDGDGFIDPDEVRWYLASKNQIGALWTGEMSISAAAKYYNPEGGGYRQHYVTSSVTGNSGSNVLIVWAEEFGSTGKINADANQGLGVPRYNVRCVRDFNTVLTGNPAAENARPESIVKVTGSNAAGWTFDLSNLAPENFRESRSQELIYGSDQNPVNNRVSTSFATAPISSQPVYPETNLLEMREDINIGIGRQNPYCPEGYRFPNNRELLIMFGYLPTTFWTSDPHVEANGVYFSWTYWSLGRWGTDVGSPDGKDRYSIAISNTGGGISTDTTHGGVMYSTVTRCVKDVYEVSLDD